MWLAFLFPVKCLSHWIVAVTDSDKIEITGSVFLCITGNAEAKVIVLKSIVLPAQERKMRILYWIFPPSSSSEMHRVAGL